MSEIVQPNNNQPHRARGAHVPGVGQFNTSVVLELIRGAPAGIERTAIADRSGLSAQTISNVTRRLISSGVVDERTGAPTGPGKPPAVLSLKADSRFAIGIHLDPAVLSATLLDLNGRRIAATQQQIAMTDSAHVMDQMAALVTDVVDNSGVDADHLIGLGVATPGPLDAVAGTVRPPRLPGWDRVPLRDTLAGLTGLPVLIERDVDVGAIGELWADPRVEDFVFVYYGTGLNSAIALGREVVRGTQHRAGRLAHLWSGPGGPECDCGKYGCLGRNVEPPAVISKARAAGVPADSLADIVAAAHTQHAAAEILAEVGRRLAEGIVTVAGFLDVAGIRLGGPSWATVADCARLSLLDGVRTAERAGRCGPVQIEETIGEDIAATGAASMVLDAAFSPHPGDVILTR